MFKLADRSSSTGVRLPGRSVLKRLTIETKRFLLLQFTRVYCYNQCNVISSEYNWTTVIFGIFLTEDQFEILPM